MSNYPDDCEQITCDKCYKYYVVCLVCKNPCIMESHSGYFSSNKYGKSSAIWLGRETELQNGNGAPITEHIIIFENEKNISIDELNPTQRPNVIISNNVDIEEEYDHDDLQFNIIDKHIVWSCDPLLELHINNDVYFPMFTGPDGGFRITYWCDTCQINYSFNDK